MDAGKTTTKVDAINYLFDLNGSGCGCEQTLS